MITSLQRFLNRYRKGLFAALLVAIVIPFVFTIGASQGIGSGKKLRAKRFFGLNLNSPKEMENFYRETTLSLQWEALEKVPIDSAIFTRATLLELANRLQIPEPGEEQLGKFIQSRPAFQEDGKFSEEKYGAFLRGLRENPPLTEAVAAKGFSSDWRIRIVAMALAEANFTLPEESELQMRQLKTRRAMVPAVLRFKNFHPSVEISDEMLRNHFEANRGRYAQGERFRLQWARFSSGKNGEDVSGERSKAAADEFVYRLYERNLGKDSPEIESLVIECGGILESIPAFSRDRPPNDLPFDGEVLRAACDLDGENFFSEPIAGDGGVHVLLFQEKLPPQDRPFEEVRDAVEADVRGRQRVKLFAERAKELRNRLVEAVARGSSFAEEASSLGFEVNAPMEFTLESIPDDLKGGQIDAILPLKIGEISEFFLQKPDLHLFLLTEKQPPQLPPDAPNDDANAAATGQLFIRQLMEELAVKELNPR